MPIRVMRVSVFLSVSLSLPVCMSVCVFAIVCWLSDVGTRTVRGALSERRTVLRGITVSVFAWCLGLADCNCVQVV